ncbi:hypothetical protein MTO98_33905 [Mucilaginibacter sp. SMC90]|uniref:hypothetical protein n=1 Tax=Mucilaginibacter sp. SMC90 TaxID=2929803 RepID=UPI001FB23D54|nr:hypothetical protein [Mucilaginibacter sp. SMC90]UOE49391.1 hypothetical protein MTO98_33905 [Mucilaginibacter sp. SMC90]
MGSRPGTTEFTVRKEQFVSRLAVYDIANQSLLGLYHYTTLAECFEMVIAHSSFGLPCFRLKQQANVVLPIEVQRLALMLFKKCLGTFAL